MKITGLTETGIRQSLSNFVATSGKGYTEDAKYLVNVIEEIGFDGKKIAKILTDDKRVFGEWELKQESEQKIIVKTVDCWENKQYLQITK